MNENKELQNTRNVTYMELFTPTRTSIQAQTKKMTYRSHHMEILSFCQQLVDMVH